MINTRGRTTRRQSPEKKSEYESKLLGLDRIAHMKAGGRRFRFKALVIVGNRMGKVGLGVAKGSDVAQSIDKATRLATKYVITIPTVQDTIPHEVFAKYSSAKVLLRPQVKGRGMVAGGTVRIICTMAGIKNISSKILGRTRNKLNNAKATMLALKKLKIRH